MCRSAKISHYAQLNRHMFLINAAIMRLALPIRGGAREAGELIIRLCFGLIKTQTDHQQMLTHSEIRYHRQSRQANINFLLFHSQDLVKAKMLNFRSFPPINLNYVMCYPLTYLSAMMYWPMRLTATPARQSNSPSPLPYSPNSLTKMPLESKTWTRWLLESATTMLLSGPTARPRGHVKDPGSLPRPPSWNSCWRLRRYTCLGIVPAAPVIPAAATAAATVGDVGEPSPFFDPSSSEEASSLAWRKGNPRLSRRETSLAVLRPLEPLVPLP